MLAESIKKQQYLSGNQYVWLSDDGFYVRSLIKEAGLLVKMADFMTVTGNIYIKKYLGASCSTRK